MVRRRGTLSGRVLSASTSFEEGGIGACSSFEILSASIAEILRLPGARMPAILFCGLRCAGCVINTELRPAGSTPCSLAAVAGKTDDRRCAATVTSVRGTAVSGTIPVPSSTLSTQISRVGSNAFAFRLGGRLGATARIRARTSVVKSMLAVSSSS